MLSFELNVQYPVNKVTPEFMGSLLLKGNQITQLNQSQSFLEKLIPSS